jgi:porin
MISALLGIAISAALQSPQDPAGFWERQTLLGDAAGVRPALAEHGVSMTLAFTGEIFASVSGGLERDVGPSLLLDWIVDADLEKAAGWSGASVRLNPMWLAGDGVSDAVGDLTIVSNIVGRTALRVYEAWLEQELFDDALSIRAGILGADQEFILTTSGMLYANSVFGGPVFLTPNLKWPIYPVGALGIRANVALTENAYLRAAVYDGDPGTEDINRTGFHVGLHGTGGAFTIAEAGWTFGDDRPTTVKLGGFLHTGEFVEFDTGQVHRGLAGGYVVVEQTLTKDFSWFGGCREGAMDVFLRCGVAEEDAAFVSLGIDAGLNFIGLVPGRPADVLGLGIVYARISRDFAGTQPDVPLWGHETVFEATYKITLSPWWILQPDFQYVVHPGGSTAIPNATVVGIRLDLLF